MKEIDVLEKIHILITVGIVLVLLGATIQLEIIAKDNIKKQDKITELKLKLKECRQ